MMEEIFIKIIQVNSVRNLPEFRISLADDKRKNLILTGKNGSGKTTLIGELKLFLTNITNGNLDKYKIQLDELKKAKELKQRMIISPNATAVTLQRLENQIKTLERWFKQFGGTKIEFNNPDTITETFKRGEFIIALFEAKRNTALKMPSGINKINIHQTYQINDSAGKEFIQYIVNLKADRSFAKDDNDNETVIKIDNWFANFENNLFKLFEKQKIKLEFDRKAYNFNFIEKSKEPYNLNQLSDGYSAILNIVTELIMRMEEHKIKSYDVQGIVLIDEIETHLHIDLQKRILPFLTSFFPKIQFIVTTHSPFVLSSIENAVICDLEKLIVTSDLTGYSYDTIIESYFNSDKYSIELKNKIEQYENLNEKTDLSDSEKDLMTELKVYFKEIPKFLSDELAVKLQQIRLKDLK